jgi:hypothetical protein
MYLKVKTAIFATIARPPAVLQDSFICKAAAAAAAAIAAAAAR